MTGKSSDFKLIDEYLATQIKVGNVPRIVDLVAYAKVKNLPLTRVNIAKHVRQNYYQYSSTLTNPKKILRFLPVTQTTLGALAFDLMFLTKRTNKNTTGLFKKGTFIVITDTLSQLVLVERIRSKRTTHVLSGIGRVLKKYKQITKVDPFSFSSDQESSLLSIKAKAQFEKWNLKTHFFANRFPKSGQVESKIRLIKQFIARFQKSATKMYSDNQLIRLAEDHLNSRKNIINNKKCRFAPKDITKSNAGSFLKDILDKEPEKLFQFTEQSSIFANPKYKMHDTVYLYKKFTMAPNISDKRITQTTTKDKYKIIGISAFLRKNKLHEYYLVQRLDSYPIKKFIVYEEAISLTRTEEKDGR